VSKEQAIEELKEIAKRHDAEANHLSADGVLCELLRSLGYGDVVDEYDKIEPKWYA
jgi:hypothetical protein